MNDVKGQLRYPDHLVALLDLIGHRGRSETVERLRWSRRGALRPWHMRLLGVIPPEGARPSALADAAGMTKQALSEFIRILEPAGYIELLPDPTDGRARIVRPTPAARELRAETEAAIRAVEAAWIAELGPERYAIFRDALETLAAPELERRSKAR